MSTIAFMVSHLSGTGHLVRILTIAKAVRAAGGEAVVISGGRPLPHLDTGGIRIAQLPWIEVRGRDFGAPLDADGQPVDATLLAARAEQATRAVRTAAPGVLVLETWPFGRRRLRREYEAVIAAMRAAACSPGRIAISVRDLPEPPSKPERQAEAEALLAQYADLVLVHGDSGFLPVTATWPLAAGLLHRLRYTGYVRHGDETEAPMTEDPREIVVSVGGGDLGRQLLQTAAEAAGFSAHPWRLRTGGRDGVALAETLQRDHARHARTGLIVEPPAADWQARLAGAAAAVTLAGYNTVTDLAPLDTPVLLVPDTAGGQREQHIRAEALSALPGVESAAAAELTPARLAMIADRLAGGPRRAPLPITLDGAARSAALLLDLAMQAER
ncbi:MAG: glycosyltransferase [Pseudomonadota bacterium]